MGIGYSMNWRFGLGVWLVSALLALSPLASLAQTGSLIFERASIRITPTISEDTSSEATAVRAVSTYDIEQRPEDALRLEYIHTLNTLTASTGVMIVLESSSIAAVPAMNVYTPIDVLFVADDGMIIKIIPNLVLGDLQQQVQARAPIKAFLFLKSGEAAARDIRPRDMVSGSMFAAPLNVQE